MSNHLISIVKNEEELIGRFIKHHSNIFDRITIIDNGSTDHTLDIIKGCDGVELIEDISHFGLKKLIIEREISKSESDIIIPMDADELLIYDNGEIDTDFDKIVKYLKSLEESPSEIYQIRRVFDYIPNTTNQFKMSNKNNRKHFFRRSTFKSICPGYHVVRSENNIKEISSLSFLHFHHMDFDKWFKSSKQKMIARLGDRWNDVGVLSGYRGASHNVAHELAMYLSTGVWYDNDERVRYLVNIPS